MPVESKLTSTTLLDSGNVTPASGETLTHGTSVGESQAVSSSTIIQLSPLPPELLIASSCVLTTSGPCAAASDAGSTPMIGGPTGAQVSVIRSTCVYQSYPLPE